MSSIRIINRATENFQGTGLPFYENQSDAFSYQSNEFNSDIGLWRVPRNKLPTFQIFIGDDFVNLVSYIWYETRGAGDFTGSIRDVTFYVASTGVQVNGIAKTIYQTIDDSTLLPDVKTNKRWQAALTLQDSAIIGPTQITLWSEEFMSTNCC
jgi:hypothetical protein